MKIMIILKTKWLYSKDIIKKIIDFFLQIKISILFMNKLKALKIFSKFLIYLFLAGFVI